MTTYNFAQLEKLWTDAGGPPEWAPTMAAVALAESGGRSDAKNPSGATGLWQTLMSAQSATFQKQYGSLDLTNPKNAAKLAVIQLRGGPGITNWVADPVGKYVAENGSRPLTQLEAQNVDATISKGAAPTPQNRNPVAGAGAGTAAQLSTSSSSGLTPAEAAQIETPYTGPGAYKGFDLQGITAGQLANVKQAINTVLSQPGGVKGILDAIYKNYGSEAWMANIPEVRTILVAGSLLGWDSNKALFDSEFQNTNWYKTTAPGVRNWQELSANDPASAANAVRLAASRVINDANSLGVQLSEAQVQSIAKTVASQSISSVTGTNTYDNSVLAESQIYSYITAAQQVPAAQAATTPAALQGDQIDIGGGGDAGTVPIPTHAPGTTAPGTPGAPGAPVTATNGGGDAAYLLNQFESINRNFMLGMTSQQLQTAVQKALQSDTGQGNFLTGQVQGFLSSAQSTAQNLYPAFSGAIGNSANGGNDQTMYQATAPYRSLIAQYTGAADADTINLQDPQWSWILSGKAPPSSRAAGLLSPQTTGNQTLDQGTGKPPTIDQMQQYLMGTPQFQTTDAAKNMAWHVGSTILKSFGYN